MKAILKKMDLIVNLKGFAAALLGVGVLVSSQGAWGQNNDDAGPIEKTMKASIQIGRKVRTSNNNINNQILPMRLPGDAEAPRDENAENGLKTDFGKSENKNVNIVLPPLKGFRQLADAEPIQKMYKELINKSVPVLVQTMMMVENGAATGFIGSMNMVSNLMNNTIQTQQFQLELMNLTDDTGQMKYAYAGKIQKAFTEEKAESWPEAIYLANGDTVTGTMGKFNAQLKDKKEPFKLNDLPNIQKDAATKKKISFLKDMLMVRVDTDDKEADGYHNNEIQKLQEEFLKYVGDIEFELKAEDTDEIARENKISYIKPKETENDQYGLSLKAKKETKKVWENINELINKLCEFKKEAANKSSGKPQLASVGAKWTVEMWEDASAPDILITQNLIEQLFSLSRLSTAQKEDLDCEKEFPKGKGLKVPFGGNFAQAEQNSPDSCKAKDQSVTPCLRFQAIYHMATVIGTSRALHTYHAMQTISGRYVKDPYTQELNDQLFRALLGGEELGVFLDQNQDRWSTFIQYLGRYVQAQGHSGANLRGGGNNATAGSGMGGK